MAGKRQILLHTCCAVCLEAACEPLAQAGFGIVAYFYNPNVHPFREFEKRLRAVEVAAEARKVRLISDREYGLQLYLDRILPAGAARCLACYRLRLESAARMAAREEIPVFTTTLLASTHQKHEAVKAAGLEAAKGAGVEFFYSDWRDRMPIAIEFARRKSLYRQHYCGCVWSEYERFGKSGTEAGE